MGRADTRNESEAVAAASAALFGYTALAAFAALILWLSTLFVAFGLLPLTLVYSAVVAGHWALARAVGRGSTVAWGTALAVHALTFGVTAYEAVQGFSIGLTLSALLSVWMLARLLDGDAVRAFRRPVDAPRPMPPLPPSPPVAPGLVPPPPPVPAADPYGYFG